MFNIIAKIFNLFKKAITTNYFMIAIIFLLQFIVLYFTVFKIAKSFFLIGHIIPAIEIVFLIYILNRTISNSYKLSWMIIVLFFPYFGWIIYLIFAEKKIKKSLRNDLVKTINKTFHVLDKDNVVQIDDIVANQIFSCVSNDSNFPYYQNTSTTFLDSGELFFKTLIDKIRNANKFIFLEFFIISKSNLLDKIIKILYQKVLQGVEVYIMYDSAGSLTSKPQNLNTILKEKGINFVEFSKIKLNFSSFHESNFRDHRKICVIDNQFGFMGGCNLGDEYINVINKFGHWNDNALMLEGQAVKSLSLMFIQFYNANTKNKINYLKYFDDSYSTYDKSFILPFSSGPDLNKSIALETHFNMINKANKYIYIHTPYLIIDYDLKLSLITAAKCGVEVIITVPHIPDKKSVFLVTCSNYEELIENGIKIYEYSPGFLHSKLIIMDDITAMCGTINMDYRSYYLNFECATLIHNDKEILKMKNYYLETLKVSKRITLEQCKNKNIFIKLISGIIKLFSPLL